MIHLIFFIYFLLCHAYIFPLKMSFLGAKFGDRRLPSEVMIEFWDAGETDEVIMVMMIMIMMMMR